MTDTEERTQRRGARKALRAKRENRSERAPADRNAVPTLRHGTENNFPTFKKKISVTALETYKDLGRMFDLNEYFVPPPVDPDEYDLEDDPHGLNLSEYKDARKARNRRIESMKSDQAGLYAFMLLHVSNESLDALKLQEGWNLADEGKDPLLLWLLIEATHRVGISSRIPAVLKAESRRAYQACAQSTYESIVVFKERFDDLLANYEEHGNPTMDADDVAMDFYRALDNSRYAAFKTNLVNNINNGAINQPDNLNEMYTQAAAFLIPTKQGHAGTHRTAFATTADRAFNRGGSGRGKGKGSGSGSDRGSKDGGKGGRGGGDKKVPPAAPNPHEDRDCWGCGERGHVLRNCPQVEEAEGDDLADGSAHMTILNQGGSDSDSDSDSDSGNRDCPYLTSDTSDYSEEEENYDSDSGFDPDADPDDNLHGDSDSESDPVIEVINRKKACATQSEQRFAYLAAGKTTEWYEVLLDNQANTSVIHPRLLRNIRRTEKPVKVGGLSGHTIGVDMVGHLDGFFDVLAYHEGAANILCMADVEDKYEITHESRHSMTVHMDDRDLVFYRRNKIYVGDMRDWETYQCMSPKSAMVTTIADNEGKLTSRELKRVEEARAFIKTAGYPTLKEAVHLVEDGNLLECKVTARDIRKAFQIDTVGGVTPAMAKGKTVNGRPPRLTTDDSIKAEEVKQQLYTDVMHVMEQKFLVSVVEPLHLTLCTPVERETTHSLGTALQEHLDTVREKGFNPIRVHCDPQGALAALSGRFPGTEIDVQGAGDHLSIVDIKIRRIKEMIRCVHADLPWKLPPPRIPDLATYAVTRVNIRRTGAAVNNVAPRVAFTGRKVRATRELGLAFGDYCEVTDPKVVGENQKSRQATTDRTESCIALFPCSNEVGSWTFLNLASNRPVRRSMWKLMVTSPLVISRMNELATGTDLSTPDASELPTKLAQLEDEVPMHDNTEESALFNTAPDNKVSANEDIDWLRDSDDLITGVEEEEQHDSDSDIDEGKWQAVTPRRSQRVAGGVPRPDRYAVHHSQTQRPKGTSRPIDDEGDPASYHAFHVSARKGLQEYGVTAYRAIMAEFEQLYKSKEAIAPVMPADLTAGEWEGVIRSSLFLNPKHDAMGVFDKVKARLVANGKQQDKELWADRSSPTAMLESIMAVLTVAAHEGRSLAGLDIGSAFLEAVWVGEPVHIVIEKMLATMLVHKYSELRHYLRSDGTLVMRLKKALYGTLIAGKLWFDKLTAVLRDMGFAANGLDPCVMNKTVSGEQLTIVIFVDDILATCKEVSTLTWLIDTLKSKFDEVKGGVQSDLSYLGMHVTNKIQEGKVEVRMVGYESELLKYAKITGVRKTPATADLFEIGKTPRLSAGELAHFHTLVAKLLYLSLRTRPQICLAVSYLTTRVTCANEEDVSKLNRVLMYINGTTDENVLTLSCTGLLRVRAYVDVAFGAHDDGKSQTGVSHHIGEGTVMAKSKKQKMVSKDSTEAELVGLTDRVDGVLRLHEFMKYQGHDMELPVIYQDNQSTISLVTKGGGKYRSVHLRVRQRRLKEKLDNGELVVEYMPTGNMAADVLTKPLQGFLFLVMVNMLLNGVRAMLAGVR